MRGSVRNRLLCFPCAGGGGKTIYKRIEVNSMANYELRREAASVCSGIYL
jgi:surfactin synthase thioesterase subunit